MYKKLCLHARSFHFSLRFFEQHPGSTKLNFLINAICNGIVKWSKSGMICHCCRRGVSPFSKLPSCIYIFFLLLFFLCSSSRWSQKFTTLHELCEKCFLALVWVNVTFNRLFTAAAMNGWVLLKGFLFPWVVKLKNDGKNSFTSSKARAKVCVVKKCCRWIKKAFLFGRRHRSLSNNYCESLKRPSLMLFYFPQAFFWYAGCRSSHATSWTQCVRNWTTTVNLAWLRSF